MIFLSKENDSNGCIGTADVSYPSIPLFLLYSTEYVKGMLRPIFRFSECEVWKEDFAPYDVGRYPYAWGQVYGLKKELNGKEYMSEDGNIFPPFYLYSSECDIYDKSEQMPIEECGNMLIMTAIVCMMDRNIKFAEPYMKILKKWAHYLIEHGDDPGEQLCTDDFCGHLAHNANLSVKAIMGIEAYSKLIGYSGDGKAQEIYHQKAKKMAADWEKRAFAGDHYTLVFDKQESWGLKYNLVWDKLFESGLFSEKVFEKEISWYMKKKMSMEYLWIIAVLVQKVTGFSGVQQ